MTTAQELIEMRHELEMVMSKHEEYDPEQDKATSLTDEGSSYVSISATGDDVLPMLVEPNAHYWAWIRLVKLRLLAHAFMTQAGSNHNGLHLMARQIGIENSRHVCAYLGIGAFVSSLLAIARAWQQELGSHALFPVRLQRNLDLIANELRLTAQESEILGLAVLVHAEPAFDDTFDQWDSLRGTHIPRLFALALGRNVEDVELAFGANSTLIKSGMLSIDLRMSGSVSSRLDFFSHSFANRMVQPHSDIFSLLCGLVDRPEPPHLDWIAYDHMREQLQGLQEHLRHVLDCHQRGVNVLFYGHPGTGKTQLARLLAQSLQYPLIAVSSTDQQKYPVSPGTRTKMLRLAQSVFGNSQALLLLDECEEIFRTSSSVSLFDNDAATASKSWITQALETNPLPTIWICNSIKDFDPAYIRRFDFCIKFDLPAAKYRHKHLQATLGSYWSEPLLHQVSQHTGASPALITRAAEIVSSSGQGDDPQYKGKLALQLLNQKLTALGYAEARPQLDGLGTFQPEYINAEINLEQMAQRLSAVRQGRICVYGPPGTGKTAFGHWLAEKLGMPHLIYRASDLLAPHVGETEQHIAKAFSRARAEGGVLQFDEVDTFLAERQSSRQGWELSMVNEMLVQMESFDGIFIASTNIFDRLDEASLRRFDLVVRFDFLRPEHAQALFEQMCQQEKLDTPDATTLERLKFFQALTPGDFQQQRRQAKFSPPSSSGELLQRLAAMNARKSSYRRTPIGFTASL